MIIGKGMIAKAFSSYSEDKEVLIFASGVSNSLQNNDSEFEREKELLEKCIKEYPKANLVYFGTCSVNDLELNCSAYVKHKQEMEKLIEKKCKKYFIFRLSQVVGKSKSPTLINFIVNKIKNKEPFNIWKNSTRNLIDVDDVFKIADYLIKNNLYINKTINIANSISLSIFDIVSVIEEILNCKGYYNIEEKGGSYRIDISKIIPHFKEIGIYFDENYLSLLIKKYYINDSQ